MNEDLIDEHRAIIHDRVAIVAHAVLGGHFGIRGCSRLQLHLATLVAKVEPQPYFLVPLTIIVVGGVVDGAGAAWNEGDRLAALRSYGVLNLPPSPPSIAWCNRPPKSAEHLSLPSISSRIAGSGSRPKSASACARRPWRFICARAILHRGPLIVPEMTQDARFTCNPLVTGPPYVRFYARALLETPHGLPLGTLCVLDYQPRELNEQQQTALSTLAAQVMAQLELRRMITERDAAVAASRRAESGIRSSFASFIIGRATHERQFSPAGPQPGRAEVSMSSTVPSRGGSPRLQERKQC